MPQESDKTVCPTTIRAFIQARMNSTRFPGKVLAPLNGRPIIARVISQVAKVIPLDQITVATSNEESDRPLACYVRDIGVPVYQGALDEVIKRFQLCLKEYPCTWFFRICADSPLLNIEPLRTMLTYADRSDIDLVSNVQRRTFPKGHSVEMVNSATFAKIDLSRLSAEEKEHLTKVYYNHPTKFRIINIESADSRLAHMSFAVDTLEDLFRLEKICLDEESPENAPDLVRRTV